MVLRFTAENMVCACAWGFLIGLHLFFIAHLKLVKAARIVVVGFALLFIAMFALFVALHNPVAGGGGI